MALLPPGSGARPDDPRVSTACWAAGRSALTPASCGLGLPARCFLEMEGVFMRSRFFLENMVTARPAGTQAPDGAGRPGATFSARRLQALAPPGGPHCRRLPYPGSRAVRLHVTGPGFSFLPCTPRPRKILGAGSEDALLSTQYFCSSLKRNKTSYFLFLSPKISVNNTKDSLTCQGIILYLLPCILYCREVNKTYRIASQGLS